MTESTEHPRNWNTQHRPDGTPYLERTFRFGNWAGAIAFVNAVSEAAESADHHPEIELSWGRVQVRWWSHDAGGVSSRDHQLARQCDELAGDQPAD